MLLVIYLFLLATVLIATATFDIAVVASYGLSTMFVGKQNVQRRRPWGRGASHLMKATAALSCFIQVSAAEVTAA